MALSSHSMLSAERISRVTRDSQSLTTAISFGSAVACPFLYAFGHLFFIGLGLGSQWKVTVFQHSPIGHVPYRALQRSGCTFLQCCWRVEFDDLFNNRFKCHLYDALKSSEFASDLSFLSFFLHLLCDLRPLYGNINQLLDCLSTWHVSRCFWLHFYFLLDSNSDVERVSAVEILYNLFEWCICWGFVWQSSVDDNPS